MQRPGQLWVPPCSIRRWERRVSPAVQKASSTVPTFTRMLTLLTESISVQTPPVLATRLAPLGTPCRSGPPPTIRRANRSPTRCAPRSSIRLQARVCAGDQRPDSPLPSNEPFPCPEGRNPVTLKGFGLRPNALNTPICVYN